MFTTIFNENRLSINRKSVLIMYEAHSLKVVETLEHPKEVESYLHSKVEFFRVVAEGIVSSIYTI